MDVLYLARQRRSAIESEIAKLDAFIATGEELLKGNAESAQPEKNDTARGADSAEQAGPKTLREFSAGGGSKK